MRLLGKPTLHDFKEKHADAQQQIDSWEKEVEEAEWETPNELKCRYPKASILKDRHIVFDLCKNKYRLLVQINYKNQIILIKKIGTHKEYDKWNIV